MRRLPGVLVNPNFSDAERQLTDLRDASRILGVELLVLKVTSESGFAGVFAALLKQRVGALLVASDPFLWAHREQLVALAARHAILLAEAAHWQEARRCGQSVDTPRR